MDAFNISIFYIIIFSEVMLIIYKYLCVSKSILIYFAWFIKTLQKTNSHSIWASYLIYAALFGTQEARRAFGNGKSSN